MAAKSLREALFKGFERNKKICSEELMTSIENELRDFFAHQTMIIGENLDIETGPNETLFRFFHSIFKDISAFKGGDK